jgi:hypothetical protein
LVHENCAAEIAAIAATESPNHRTTQSSNDMIPAFAFYRTPQVIFGAGSISKLALSLSSFGKNILLITGG